MAKPSNPILDSAAKPLAESDVDNGAEWLTQVQPTDRVVPGVIPVARQAIALPGARHKGKSFDQLLSMATSVDGSDLTQDKSPLIGVPFIITAITFRDGVKRGNDIPNYLSVEIITASAEIFRQRIAKGFLSAKCPFGPEEALVFNDGSTGIARQITSWMHARGIIDVGVEETADNQNGAMGTSMYDTYWKKWAHPVFAADAVDPYFDLAEIGSPLFCPRGLRDSQYVNESTSSDGATTYYIA